MNLDILTAIILEHQDLIKNLKIVPREYSFEQGFDYVLVGLRRAGKSYLLFQQAQKLVANGVDLSQIIYINFEDERLVDFQLQDFNEIIAAANQISPAKHYYFFDEIQNVDGWERFARRMADQKETVYLTGSNSKMLGRDILMRLGGRYLVKYVSPFNFNEYLTAKQIPHQRLDLLMAASKGQINAALNDYLSFGGLPEATFLASKRDYLNSIYQGVYLADIVVRNSIRNPTALRLMVKKIAETVMHEISYTKLTNAIKSVGVRIGKNSVIDYAGYAQDAYLLFRTSNYFDKFSNRESLPRFYFTDNGLLNIFLVNHSAALLENQVAVKLFNQYQSGVYYLKSSKTGIDVDFYVPATKTAIQVAWTLESNARQREIEGLVKLANSFEQVDRLIVVTKGDSRETIHQGGVAIQVLPLIDFLLGHSPVTKA